MAPMGLLLLPLLVAGTYGAPGTLFDIGGTVGYESEMNGTIGGALKATRDGLSVNTTGNGIIGASWAPTLIAKGHAQVGESLAIAGDASMKTVIDNSWQPGFKAALGRNSNGEWIVGLTPESLLKNKILFTPNAKLLTGEDAKKLAGLTAAANQNQQTFVNPGSYPTFPGAPNANFGQDPYAAYYAQALLQAQYAQAMAQAAQAAQNAQVKA